MKQKLVGSVIAAILRHQSRSSHLPRSIATALIEKVRFALTRRWRKADSNCRSTAVGECRALPISRLTSLRFHGYFPFVSSAYEVHDLIGAGLRWREECRGAGSVALTFPRSALAVQRDGARGKLR